MTIKPLDQVLWYLKRDAPEVLRQSIKADIAIIGGGMAGITAAQAFKHKGLSVVLVEKSYCGAGASGKSSGFITPDSEFSLHDMAERYGDKEAHKLWEFVLTGVEYIRNNIDAFSLDCDYQVEDTCVVANTEKAFTSDIVQEHKTRTKLGYQSTLYTPEKITSVIGSTQYAGAIRYGGSFGINAYRYCQEMKKIVQNQGVTVYEETPALSLEGHTIFTPFGRVTADQIIVCADQFTPQLGLLTKEIYHAQTFLMLSARLTDREVREIFPEANLMVWDTDLIYNYYRMTGDNRLMLGGSSLLNTYDKDEQHHNWRVVDKLQKYFKEKFPHVALEFEYVWPGLIGVTKDIMPIAGCDERQQHIYCIAGAAGLPWAAALALYSVDHIIDGKTDFDTYLSPTRKFPLSGVTQTLLGTRLTFALSHLLTLKTL
jgi:gamma-glutamylputrescine oxidase